LPANTGVARAMHRGVFFAGRPAPTLPLQPSPAPILCHLHLGKAQIPSNPRKTALKAQYFRAFQNWHAPCNSYCISSFGGLGTGRPGYPLFYSQHRPFRGPRYRQAGTPSFIRNIARFGDLGTGRPGLPLLFATSPVLGTLVQAGRDIPSFIRAASPAPASAQRPLQRPTYRSGDARPPP